MTNTWNPLQEQDFIQLQQIICPISPSDCHGIDLYIRTLEFVLQKILYYRKSFETTSHYNNMKKLFESNSHTKTKRSLQ